jgi:hypothetical protein
MLKQNPRTSSSGDKITREIARVACKEWTRKAAKLRVAAQDCERTGIYDGVMWSDPNDQAVWARGERQRLKEKVQELHADADAAERFAREWDAIARNDEVAEAAAQAIREAVTGRRVS